MRILHLEDDACDFELVRGALERQNLACQLTRATSRTEFEQALESSHFDLVLSDFALPDYDGMSALKQVRSVYPDMPVLFVSGTIGEERAIESLKSGATDYVLKDHLERLVPAVHRAVREARERFDRRRAEEALRESEHRFRQMAETIRDVFWITTADAKKILYISPAYETVWGRSTASLRAQPTSWLNAIVEEDRPRVLMALEQLATGQEFRVEYRIERPDGSQRWIEDRGYPVPTSTGVPEQVLGVATDITSRKQLETELRQSQKLEAIGQLAGGIAHDFNNVLTVINGRVGLLLDRNDLGPEITDSLRAVYSAGEHAAGLTSQLLAFSRKQVLRPRILDLNEVIGEIANMLRHLIGEHIKLKLDLFPTLPCIRADSGMIEQVLLNLAVNARDAMPKGGFLTIKTEPIRITAADRLSHPDAREGEFVCFQVQDTGCGIDPKVLPHIFEPFFTTKGPGKGTGLGMATVFGIMKQHEGWITVDSQPGLGTVFRALLPAAPPDSVKTATRQTQPATKAGNETILLVEDEASVRELGVAVLKKYGYRVLQAESGTEALDVWKWHAPRISLLLTDIVLAGDLSGLELAEMLQKQKPELKVISVSGYNPEMAGQTLSPTAGPYFLQKPYQPRALAKIVRDVLDG